MHICIKEFLFTFVQAEQRQAATTATAMEPHIANIHIIVFTISFAAAAVQ